MMRKVDVDVRGGSTMSRKFSFVTVVLAAWAALLLVLLLVGAPALAHHKNGHENGGGNGGGGAATSDHDGDADSDVGTAREDSHEADSNPDTDNMHPSGNDKSGESGGSGNQGKAESDPDAGDNGGKDKPGGAATAGGDRDDQDGNNGCGNDDDFEDDNKGKCLRGGQEVEAAVEAAVEAEVEEAPVVGGEVIGQVPTMGAPAVEVLGERVTRARPEAAPQVKAKGAALPFTGGNIASLVILALGLMTTGGLLVRLRSR